MGTYDRYITIITNDQEDRSDTIVSSDRIIIVNYRYAKTIALIELYLQTDDRPFTV